ncbi:Tetratricopeptide repeat (TPR)-like superfamily protein [Euphorbia peplus]|nr:Tetratricopeptide repeat (TPR)-like superfamily protein [Euphorbia peplus]
MKPIYYNSLIKFRNAAFTRLYYSNTPQEVTLLSKITSLHHRASVFLTLQNSFQNGYDVRPVELQNIIQNLRKQNRFSQALEVSEWMNRTGICVFSPVEHAIQLSLIGKVHGCLSAENYFRNLTDNDKNDRTYAALLHCYVLENQTEKAISHWQKMKDLGYASSTAAYNDIMNLYTKLGLYEKIPGVLTEMKENYVSPDNLSYRMCISSYGARYDLQGIERVLNEMEHHLGDRMDWNTYAVVANFYIQAGLSNKAYDALRKSEEKIDEKDGSGYNFLISHYATLGNKAEVWRLWDLGKHRCKKQINRFYKTMLQSLVKLGDLEGADKIRKDWESSNGIECMKVAYPVKNKEWKPNPRVIGDSSSWPSDEGKVEENRPRKVPLYSRISSLDPGTSVLPELENEVQNGNKVRLGELQHLIHDLRKKNRFSHALEVSEWMNKTGIYIFSPTEHAIQLNLIGKVHGFLSAENYFRNLTDNDKNEMTYGALLNCYVTAEGQTEKCISHWQKMKELGYASTSLPYNDIMSLYSKLGHYEKIPGLFSEMKENNVSPNNFTYRICIHSYGARSDLEGMIKVLNEMEHDLGVDWNTYAVVANFYIKAGLFGKANDVLKKAEEKIDKKDGSGYNYLISLYATLGNEAEVLRLWDLEKKRSKRQINRDYITILQSLVKIGNLEEADKILQGWKSSGNAYDVRIPNIVVWGYCSKGLVEKAEALLNELMEKGKMTIPNSWAVVTSGYLKKGEMAKAIKCMKAGLSVDVKNKWEPNRRVIKDMLSWLGNKGEVEDIKAFLASVSNVFPVNHRQAYHALLKASVRSGKDIGGVLEQMKAHNIDEDEETKKILSTMVNIDED